MSIDCGLMFAWCDWCLCWFFYCYMSLGGVLICWLVVWFISLLLSAGGVLGGCFVFVV